jgi:hypothetical protein
VLSLGNDLDPLVPDTAWLRTGRYRVGATSGSPLAESAL